jgi:hypothetical protein
MMSEAILQRWDSTGVFTDPAQRVTVGSLSSFLAAEMIQVTESAGAATPQGGAPAAPGQE